MTIRTAVCATVFLAAQAFGADEPGIWKLTDRQVEKPKPEKPGSPCTFTYDSGDQGLSFTHRCLWPDRKRTSTFRCQYSWRSDAGLGSLTPGQKITFTGTVNNLGDAGSCTGYVVLGSPGISVANSIVNHPTPGATKSGTVTIPGKLVNPRTNQVNALPLAFHLTGGNETRFVVQRFVYQWKPTQGQAAAPQAIPPPLRAAGSSHLGCYADAAQRDLNGTPDTLVRDASACVQNCAAKGFRYAAVQYGGHCFCGNSFGRYGTSTACKPCTNSPKEFCGGTWANSVYEVKK